METARRAGRFGPFYFFLYFYFIELSKTHMPSKLAELTSAGAAVYGSFALAWGLDNILAGHQD